MSIALDLPNVNVSGSVAPVTWPSPPEILRRPLSLDRVAIPSRFFLAPLAGYTNLAFRLAVRSLGGLGLATTDLVNARSLIEGTSKAFDLSETCAVDTPMSVQIYGPKLDEMAIATRVAVDRGAQLVDINMGCPVRKVVRCGGGSALMAETDKAVRLVSTVVEAAEGPVTVKMRLGWAQHNQTAPAQAPRFEQVGVAGVIVHGRTRAQGFSGDVDRQGIRAVVEAVERIPVVGNGDIRSLQDAERMFRETGCAAVSIGRGALANPFFFTQLKHWAEYGTPGPEPSFEQRLDLMADHFHRLLAYRGQHMGCIQFRKTLRWYSKWTRMAKFLYRNLIQIADAMVFDQTLERIRQVGPISPLPGHLDVEVPVPKGPIDKW